MTPPAPAARIVDTPIDAQQLLGSVDHERHGAAILFIGVVRNHNDGRPVSGMRYEAYAEMAEQVLGEIVAEATASLGEGSVAAVHRVGELDIGEASVAIAVSSPHRDDAYRASRYVIEEIKKRLPVWKHEHYTDGSEAWVAGVEPVPTSEVSE